MRLSAFGVMRTPLRWVLLGATLAWPAWGQDCTSDSDCAEGERCRRDDEQQDVACEEGVAPDECAARAAEASMSSGICEPGPYTCQGDSDCPEPTACDDGQCVFRFVSCGSDDECSDRYACTTIRSGLCSVDPEANQLPGDAAMGDPGGVGDGAPSDPATDVSSEDPGSADSGEPAEQADPADPPNDLAPADEVDPRGDPPPASDADVASAQPAKSKSDGDTVAETCDSPKFQACLPRPTPCESDADCDDDWRCVEVPDARIEDWDGVDTACLPEGMIGVFEGRVEIDQSTLPDDLTGDSDTSGQAVSEEDGVELDPIGDGNGDDSPLGTQGGSEGKAEGGCSVGETRRSSSPTWLLLGLVGWVALRRRVR